MKKKDYIFKASHILAIDKVALKSKIVSKKLLITVHSYAMGPLSHILTYHKQSKAFVN